MRKQDLIFTTEKENVMKKILGLLLVLCMLVGAIPVLTAGASAATTSSSDLDEYEELYVQEGMTIRMHTTLQPLEEEVNPHGWSDRTWFAAKGVVYTCEGAVDAHSETAPYSLRGDLRSRMRSHIEALWPQEKELLTALLLGYDELLSDETMEAFRRSGAAHLLAVSGLHVGFVATLALVLFGWLRKGSVGRMLLVLACLGAYALVAESAFSVFRAVLMMAMVLCAQCCGRRADGTT